MSLSRFALLCLLLSGCAAAALPPPVQLVNASRPTRCAEEDNVDIRLAGPDVRRFSIVARHPPYIGTLLKDSKAPDFTSCDMRGNPSFPGAPREVVLHRDADWQLVGLAFTSFWRPARVPVQVGARREEGLHLLQLFRTLEGRRIEVLVLYPADGYWRAKPLPPPHLVETAYGSSFLVGPVEEQGRPLVALQHVEYVPGEAAFRLRFERGGTGMLRVAKVDRTEVALAVSLDDGAPVFAALRSMFVATDNNDVAEASWLGSRGDAEAVSVMRTPPVPVAEVRFGRTALSRHNSSAPDIVFTDFER